MKATIILYTLLLLLGLACIFLPQLLFGDEITRYWGIVQWVAYFSGQLFGVLCVSMSAVVLYQE